MALLDWIQDHSNEDLREIVDALDAGDLPDEQVQRLRDLIQDETLTIREEAVRLTERPGEGLSLFNELELALELDPTPPPEPAIEVGDGVEIAEVDEARQDALDSLDSLLQPGAGRDFQFFDSLRAALEACDASLTGMVTQETMDALSDEDCEELAERAGALASRHAASAESLAEFEEIQSALRRGPGRAVTYFEGALRELRGEESANRLPADPLEQIRQAPAALEEAIDLAESHVDALEGDGEIQRGPEISPAPTERPDVGATGTVQDEDYLTGETITRDPQFEQKFVQFARELGRARDFDLFPLPPDDYFALTERSQEKLYDVTPQEFMRRSIRRGETTCQQLRSRYGFATDELPGTCQG